MTINLDFWPTVSFALVMFCWFGFAAVFLIKKRPPSPPSKKRDRGSLIGVLLQGAGYAVVWAWHRRPFSPILSLGETAEIVMVIVTALISLGSVLIVLAAIQALGKEWSVTARLVEGHKLVTVGPYSFVRHPIYTGMFGMLLATGLAISCWMALVLGVLIFAIGTAIRVRSEEKLLREAFGAQFEDYTQRVPAVIPYLF